MSEEFGQTTLSPIGAAVLLPLLAAVLTMSRHFAVAAFLAAVCFVSDGQRLSIAGLDFTPIRMLIAVGALRVLARSEYSQLKWQTIDSMFVCYVFWGYAAYALRYEFEFSALVRRAGEMYTYTGTYFLCRCWLRNGDDVAAFAKAFAILAIPSGLFFAAEWMTGRNIFSIFGGVPEITGTRDGRLRCRGPFPHAILAGCFWAGACPLIASLLWRKTSDRLIALAGLAGAMLVIASCASSTPLLALAAMIFAAGLYRVRGQLRAIQIGVIVALVVIHFARTKPVWHLLGRINVVGGSTGHHRYLLIDNAIKHFDEWGLVGTKATAHWGHQMFDVTNQFLLEGVRGGIVAMLLFTTVLLLAFRKIGGAVRHDKRRPSDFATWLVGSALFGHSAIFFSVAYFGQVPVIFWSTLAAAVAVASGSRVGRPNGAAMYRMVYPVLQPGVSAGCLVPAFPLQRGVGAGPILQVRSRRNRWSK
ncbi:MAG: hypothetical protein WBC44_14920 [Planctomycetaceae bacterium]